MAVDSVRAKSLFLAAAERADPAERAAYLDRECGGEAELRARVEALLRADKAAPPPDTATADRIAPLPTTTDYRGDGADAGTVIAGKYTLVDVVGEGGMGTVWRARQTEPVKRFVAVKLVKAGMDSRQVLARFEAERQALALMDHPHIAKVLDGGLHGHQPYFVMELVKGVPITAYCDQRKLTPRERLELFVPVCQAIQHAHQKGIIHRDIKPSNVLVALYDDKPVVKVIDFGVAKATGGTLTEHTLDTGFGAVVGTPQYMSPEQATFNNLDIDTRSDVYALGVLLYELLTGSPPFSKHELEQKGLLEMLRVVREEEPPRPSAKLSTAETLPTLSANRDTESKKLIGLLRQELDWVVMKALEKDRTRRYETATGLAADVQRYLAGEPVAAHPPSAAYRLRKFVRRNRAPVTAAGLVLVALVAGIVGTTLGLLEARRQAGLARTEAEAKEEARQAEAAERAKADVERRKAVEFRDKALEALRATTGTDVEKLIGGKKELGANERAYLEAIAQRWQTFAKQEGTDEQTRAVQAEGHSRVAHLWHKLDQRDAARAEYEKTLGLLKQLVERYPAEAQYQQELAGTHNNLGYLLAGLGQRDAARTEYEKARGLQEQLVEQYPAMPDYQQELAMTKINMGILLQDLGQRDAARAELEKARGLLKQLAAQYPAVPKYQQVLARTHNNLGVLLWGLGQPDAARAEYEKAHGLRKQLAAQHPAVPEYQQELAGTHNSLGYLLAGLGQRDAARAEYEKARGLQKQLVEQYPAMPDYQQELAMTHNNMGILLASLGQRHAARVEDENALGLRKQLVAQYPAVPEYQRELASTHNNLGALLASLGQRDAARAEYEKARGLYKQLAAQYPAVPEYQTALGGSYCNFGNLISDEGRADASLTWFDKAIATLEPVHRAEPRAVTARQFLRNSYHNRAIAYDALKRHAEAIEDWGRAIEFSPPSEQGSLRAARTNARVQAGQIGEAVAETDTLTRAGGWNAGQWYDFACVYAVASGKLADKKQEHADRAMASLRQAVQAGYRNAAHMKQDTDLDPLRGRDDFKKLLADLDKPAANKP